MVVNEEHVRSYTITLPRANRVATVTDSPTAISKCDKIRSVFGCICFYRRLCEFKIQYISVGSEFAY